MYIGYSAGSRLQVRYTQLTIVSGLQESRLGRVDWRRRLQSVIVIVLTKEAGVQQDIGKRRQVVKDGVKQRRRFEKYTAMHVKRHVN